MTAASCRCAEQARRVLALTGVDPDTTPTPPLVGDGPDVVGTCEHGVAWPVRDEATT